MLTLVLASAGTLCDADGELFIKPCTQSEVDFYHAANDNYPHFAQMMPLFMGTLTLDDPSSIKIEDTLTGLVTDNGRVETLKEHIEHTVVELASSISKQEPPQTEDNIKWLPNRSKKIKTNLAVVLDNASHGFQQPNILDAKLGVRLWADDAPLEKKQRFDAIAKETTHKNLGFRIAGMRVYRGSEDPKELDEEEYKIYDKDFGRITVNDANIVETFRKFVFSPRAGINEELGKAVCTGFLKDLKHVEELLMSHESRMYSSSLLFLMEGDGEALRAAIEENNTMVERLNNASEGCHPTKRVDSGIALEDDSDCEELENLSSLPKIYALKLIDFAHAHFVPGLGPDENMLKGVRSLITIFEKMLQS